MSTQFKQKTCPKCRNNHDNEGLLCSFCIQKEDLKKTKIQPSPDNFWIKCLIQREGNTVLTIGRIQYTFKPNELGDNVCEIINQGHYYQLLKSDFYEPYVPQPIEEEKPKVDPDAPKALFTAEQIVLIEVLVAQEKKVTEIAAALSEGQAEPVPWQRVSKFLKNKEA